MEQKSFLKLAGDAGRSQKVTVTPAKRAGGQPVDSAIDTRLVTFEGVGWMVAWKRHSGGAMNVPRRVPCCHICRQIPLEPRFIVHRAKIG